jgi:hypothetical protein
MKARLAVAATAIAALTAAAHADSETAVVSCAIIKTPAQLQAINKNTATKSGSYCLGNDIDMSAVTNWTPIGDGSAPPVSGFNGQFYGRGHVIKNLKITGNADNYYGLFGVVTGGVIRDVGLVNVQAAVTPPTTSYVGALAGIVQAMSSPIFISNVYSTGSINCTTGSCAAGGLVGVTINNVTLTNSWSSADVTSSGYAGGFAAAFGSGPSNYQNIYATGNVTGLAGSLEIGGLIGEFSSSTTTPSYLTQGYATGRVTGGTSTLVGGLIGKLTNSATIYSAYATGPVSGGASATVGGLIGQQSDSAMTQVFSVGAVSGGSTSGGLVGSTTGSPTALYAYWDMVTSGKATSAGGAGRTTTQLQGALPAGFKLGWGINKTLSYPYLNDPTNFSSTLATLVLSDVVFTFLPIGQRDASQYLTPPVHADQASLATVYAMIGRAIGVTDNVGTLQNVKIDKYYWHDATQTTTFSGPITTHATLGPMKTIAAATPLDGTNVVGEMNAHRAVILRGTYKKAGGGAATHYMLGTLYTKLGANVSTIVANDPYTGTQIEISPKTKTVVTPNFPLAGFVVDGYRSVTTLN